MLHYGSSRITLIIWKYAIKIPRITHYISFLNGLKANYNEKQWYESFKSEKLCPILFSLPLGIILVMPKVQILSNSEFNEIYNENDWYLDNEIKIPVEPKNDSFGYYGGKLVCVDYG